MSVRVSAETNLVYEFGGFRLHLAPRILMRNGKPVALTPKVFDTLVFLVQNHGQVLTKAELIQALWPESFVEEGNLSQNIFILRKTLGEDQNGNGFIQTIAKRGYKFVPWVREYEVALPETGGQSALPADYWRGHSPFRSLQVFEPEDTWLFFGRDPETEDLLARLGRTSVVVVAGNSGSGKSSLIRAGLISALHQGRFHHGSSPIDTWRIAVFRPSEAPFDYLAETLSKQLAPNLSLKERTEFIADCRNKLPAGGDALRNAICALMNTTTEEPATHILLVADQFEEIFTLTANPTERQKYIDLLLNAGRQDGAFPVHLVLVLRADFYANCLEHLQLSRCLEANLYNVPRMTHAQLRETIEKRLALAAATAEPGLIDSLLQDVGTEPGNLALLEHALGQLWEKCGGYGCLLTNQAYSEIGRLRGALGRHADQVYGGLGDENQKRLARRIFLELVQLGEGAQDTRRRVSKAELLSLSDPDEVEHLLAQLSSSRLIATGAEAEQTFVEVSHEALIREWPVLREWIVQNREEIQLERRLLQMASEWQALNQDSGALLQGARLAQAEEWFARCQEAPRVLHEFVQTSLRARAETARKERETQERELALREAAVVAVRRSAVRLRWFSCALAILLLIAVGAAWLARQQRIILESHILAKQAAELMTRDHGRALDLAIHSWRMAKTEETYFAVVRAFPESIATLKHDGEVTEVAFSPDGKQILTCSDDRMVRIWNAIDGRLLLTLQGHTDKIKEAAFSPDGQRIVTASDDHTARLWNSADGRLLAVLQGHTDNVWRAAFSPDGKRIVTASHDHTARVWNAEDGRLLVTLQGHTDQVAGAQFSRDSQRIVTVSHDHTARVWNAEDGRLLATLLGHTNGILFAEFFPDNERIITTSFDGTARIWNSRDGRLLALLQHNGTVEYSKFSPDGELIVTASHDHTARVWKSANGSLLLTLQHDGPVDYAEFSRDGRRIVTASLDHTARVWNRADGRLLAVLQDQSSVVYHATFSPDGQRIVTSGDHSAQIWNLTAGRLMTTLPGHTGYLTGAYFSPEGQRVVTTSADGTARSWNGADGVLLSKLLGHNGPIWMATSSSDGKRIVTAGYDRTAKVWNALDGRLLFTLQGHTDQVVGAQFSPDGQRIVTVSEDHTARLWDSSDGRSLAVLNGHAGKVRRAVFSPDGERIVTASSDHTGRVWNATDGQLLATLEGHTDQLVSAEFSPDGQRIVTASSDHTARVWNAMDGRLLVTLQGHADQVVYAQFSPDGRRIVTASSDHTARVWDAMDGRLLVTLEGHTDQVRKARFSPDGQHIVTASYDATARIWNSADGRVEAILQGHTEQVIAAAFSMDGQRIVTGSFDQTARIWQVLALDDIERILAK